MFCIKTGSTQFDSLEHEIFRLGRWCAPNKQDGIPEIKQQISTHDEVCNAMTVCSTVFEKTLIPLSTQLNSYHQMNQSVEYYRLLLGPWLLHFIHQMYDKYLTVCAARELYQDITAHYLHPDQWVVATDFNEYMQLFMDSDLAIEQQFAQVMQALNIPGQRIYVQHPLCQSHSFMMAKQSLAHRLTQSFTTFLQKMLRRTPVIISEGYNRMDFYRLAIFSGFRFAINDYRNKSIHLTYEVDWQFRKSQSLEVEETEFGEMIGKTTLLNIPSTFLETFSSLKRCLRTEIESMPKILLTAVGLSGYNSVLSLLVAESLGKTKRILCQHGGNYGTDRVHALETLEKGMAHRFVTWGWGQEENGIMPLPTPILSRSRAVSHKDISKSGVSLTMTAVPRYTFRINSFTPDNMINPYLENIFQFINGLKNTKKDVLIRKYSEDYGWSIEQRIVDHFPWMQFDDNKRNFEETLMESRICIFGHLSTTYIQALVANRPTVIFIDRNICCHREDAKPYFAQLERVGILYYSPIEAAKHVEDIYDNVGGWWFREDVQKAKDSFLWKYGRSSNNWMIQWQEAFKTFLEE